MRSCNDLDIKSNILKRRASELVTEAHCSSTKANRTRSKRIKSTIVNSNKAIENNSFSSNSSTSGISIYGEDTSNSENTTPGYICEKCAWHCTTMKVLKEHIKSNCRLKPQYNCPQCFKNFSSSSTLNCHLSIHTGELPFECEYCGKRFRTRGQVTVHHRTHTGERPFVCQVCYHNLRCKIESA